MPSPDAKTRARIQADVVAYQSERAVYEDYARLLTCALQRATKELAPDAFVQARAKSVSSFAEKAARNHSSVPEPLQAFTDLCGARVIVSTPQEVEAVCRFVEAHFTVDAERSQDVRERLSVEAFGYGSVHYIVQVQKNVFVDPTDPGFIPTDVTAAELERWLDRIGDRWAEIQIRTMLEHAWADICHDRLYKVRISVPKPWARRLHGTAALIEVANREFAATSAVIDDFLRNYELYLPRPKLEQELEELTLVHASEPTPALGLRLARLARVAQRWDDVIAVARASLDRALRERRELQAELGHALCRRAGHGDLDSGQDLLRELGAPDSIHLDQPSALQVERDELRARALGWLAASMDATSGADPQQVRELYRKASLCDPDNPYLLAAHLERQAQWERRFDGVAAAHHQIRAAIARCREHATVGVAIPDCYFAIGKLHLLLQQFDASIDAYARAIAISESSDPIEAEARAVDELRRHADRRAPELDWVRILLHLGVAQRSLAIARDGEAEAAAQAALARLAAEFSIEPQSVRPPAIIVAGAAAPMSTAESGKFLQRLREAFVGFAGTIYSGGTRAGVPGIVGAIAAEPRPEGQRLDVVAYVPTRFPPEGPVDDRYTRLVPTGVPEFTPLQPLCGWIELLASGVDPATVRLLGISGGPIAAFEYRLALALGATVGLVAGSGRAVADLQNDDVPWPSDRLLFLPDDTMTIRAFVQPLRPSELLTEDVLEEAARAVHCKYLESVGEKRWAQPNLAPWEDLREDLKQSNRDQIMHAAQVLAAEGYEVRPAVAVGDDEQVETFAADQVRRMAEKEHGRWNVERLAAGWRYGDIKDVARKISPFLTEWSKLAPNIQDYDVSAVREWPRVLAGAGLAICKRRRTP